MVWMDLQQYVQEAGSAVHARPSWIAICSTRGPCGAGSQISLRLKWIPCYLHSWKKEWLSWILTPCCCLTWPTISFGRQQLLHPKQINTPSLLWATTPAFPSSSVDSRYLVSPLRTIWAVKHFSSAYIYIALIQDVTFRVVLVQITARYRLWRGGGSRAVAPLAEWREGWI